MAEIDMLDEDNKDLILKSRQVARTLTATLDDLAEIKEAQDETQIVETIDFKRTAEKAMPPQSTQISETQALIIQSLEVPDVRFPSSFLDSILKHLLITAIKF